MEENTQRLFLGFALETQQQEVNALQQRCVAACPGARMVAAGFYVLELQHEILACGQLDQPNCKLEALFVQPKVMGKGYGRLMLQYLERQAKACNIRHLSLESSLNAAPFYQHCGWQSLGHSRYHSPKGMALDCILMEKNL